MHTLAWRCRNAAQGREFKHTRMRLIKSDSVRVGHTLLRRMREYVCVTHWSMCNTLEYVCVTHWRGSL